MAMQSVAKVRPVPQGHNQVIPYLVVEGAPKLIEFLKHTFNAQEIERVTTPDGRITHAEVRIGDSIVMLANATNEYKPNPSQIYVYIEDVDKIYRRALDAGATSVQEPKDQFYGDRNATVKDSFGNIWYIATHVEDVSMDEMQRRMKERSSNP
jgi:PhnB protein